MAAEKVADSNDGNKHDNNGSRSNNNHDEPHGGRARTCSESY